MPSEHDIVAIVTVIAVASLLKFVFRNLDRRDQPADDLDLSLHRLKNGRMSRGECIYCAAELPPGFRAVTLTSSVCAACAAASSA